MGIGIPIYVVGILCSTEHGALATMLNQPTNECGNVLTEILVMPQEVVGRVGNRRIVRLGVMQSNINLWIVHEGPVTGERPS